MAAKAAAAEGWEKIARPAERAVAVMQSQSNLIRDKYFVSRWGQEVLDDLLEADVVTLREGYVVLKAPYRGRERWHLEFAQEHGEAALKRRLQRVHRQAIEYADQKLREWVMALEMVAVTDD